MFALPCLLMVGLVLLFRDVGKTVGFSLIALSGLLYLAFIFLEDALAPERMGRGDWFFTGIYVMFCAIAAAGWFLSRQITPRAE
jgi:hypothetical protein